MKVLICLLFICDFLGQTVYSYSEFNDHKSYEVYESNLEYPEFVRNDYDSLPDSQIASAPREEQKRSKENKKHKYQDEQDWNDEALFIEELPYAGEISEDMPADQHLHRTTTKRELPYRGREEVKDINIESDESRRSYGPKVFELNNSDGSVPEALLAENIEAPDVVYHKGVAYVKVPRHVLSYVGKSPRPPGPGAPPLARYVHDQTSSASGKPHSQARSDGHHGHQHHDGEYGKKSDKGYKTVHHSEEGKKGSEGRQRHSSQYDEAGGQKKSHEDVGGHYGEHHEGGKGKKGGQFDEKKGHKKGHNTKGYHNKFHKDEYHKEHKFYDDFHRSGSHQKYGDFKAQHGSKEGGHHKKAHHDSALDHKDAGKKGQYAKGHEDSAHKGHKHQKGQEKHYSHHSDYGKKGGKQGGKQYAYKTEH